MDDGPDQRDVDDAQVDHAVDEVETVDNERDGFEQDGFESGDGDYDADLGGDLGDEGPEGEHRDAHGSDEAGESPLESPDAGPVPVLNADPPPTTGDTTIDEALSSLADADSAPLADRIEAGETTHRVLQAKLNDLGGA